MQVCKARMKCVCGGGGVSKSHIGVIMAAALRRSWRGLVLLVDGRKLSRSPVCTSSMIYARGYSTRTSATAYRWSLGLAPACPNAFSF